MRRSRTVLAVLLIIVSYMLGTFPSAILIARANGIEISTFGSGNPGASNVTRALGWRKGIWVYILDALKAGVATGLGLGMGFDWAGTGRPLAYACAAAAILGHMFPVFRHFKGGKGVACGSGVIMVLQPMLGLAIPVVWWTISKVTGKAAIGSIVTVALVPLGLALLGRPAWEFVATAGLSALILVKHWRNFGRLIRREEPPLRDN
ncbi:MAG: glycerol-3-phosphate acyltransferase [Ilumatobacter sp.]|nr:glycerol-3-phosphate acyltransferase [Ilumatobacter sp.]